MGQQETDNPKGAIEEKGLAARLEEIRDLEQQVIRLKHQFIEASAIIQEDESEEEDPTFLFLKDVGRLFAIPISHVEEVIQTIALIPLPEEVQGVAGLINYHGEMMAVIDFGVLFGAEEKEVTADRSLVICITELMRFAVLIDEASDVVTVPTQDIDVTDEVLPGALRALGVLRAEGEAILILDVLSIVLSVQLHKVGDALSSPPPPVTSTSEEEHP
ncbi:MAG: chemotaxis protein CheW [Myxococcota bacterium]|nr:chemotaxis protein CheW [Myxococcota bacterium]